MFKIRPIKIKFLHFDSPENTRRSDTVYFRVFDISLKNLMERKDKGHIIKNNG